MMLVMIYTRCAHLLYAFGAHVYFHKNAEKKKIIKVAQDIGVKSKDLREKSGDRTENRENRKMPKTVKIIHMV